MSQTVPTTPNDIYVLASHSGVHCVRLEYLLVWAIVHNEVVPGMLVEVTHYGVMRVGTTLCNRLLHMTVCVESDQVILPVPLEWTFCNLVIVVNFESTSRPTLGALPVLLFSYIRS